MDKSEVAEMKARIIFLEAELELLKKEFAKLKNKNLNDGMLTLMAEEESSKIIDIQEKKESESENSNSAFGSNIYFKNFKKKKN